MSFPAARMTDMHTCPMVNGIVPHVGGPISLEHYQYSSATFLQPA